MVCPSYRLVLRRNQLKIELPGTDADCSKENKKSVICELSEVLKQNPDYHIYYKRGIGTGSSVGESWWNGLCHETLFKSITDLFQPLPVSDLTIFLLIATVRVPSPPLTVSYLLDIEYLVDNYRDGYIIIVAGWSRGLSSSLNI